MAAVIANPDEQPDDPLGDEVNTDRPKSELTSPTPDGDIPDILLKKPSPLSGKIPPAPLFKRGNKFGRGRRSNKYSLSEWLSNLADEPYEVVASIARQPKSPASKRAAARLWASAGDPDNSASGREAARKALGEIVNRLIGKPVDEGEKGKNDVYIALDKAFPPGQRFSSEQVIARLICAIEGKSFERDGFTDGV